MQTNIEAAGQSLPDGQTMKVNFSNVEAKVNKDGNLTSFAFKIDAKYVSDKEESPYNYTIVADFTNFGKTKVDVVTKTDDYKDASVDFYFLKQYIVYKNFSATSPFEF